MKLNDLRDAAGEWFSKNFGPHPDWGVQHLVALAEEVGELCEATLKASQNIRDGRALFNTKATDAVGDIIIVLANYCYANRIDFEAAVQNTWQEVRQRDWRKYPFDGRTK